MVNMRMLIRIVFAIFIAKGFDSLGGVCDDCCDCLKEKKNKNEEINKDKDENEEIAISLVNDDWYKSKKNPVLKIFIKEENGIFKDNGNKVSFKLEGNNNPKIAYQNETEDKLNLKGKKYALFEIKTQEGEDTVYLYCSDVESLFLSGIFEKTNHVSISVIACNTKNVTNIICMFFMCSNLKELYLNNFDTTNVKNMEKMFENCSNLKELDLRNFNTTNVTDMGYMFKNCNSLKEIKFGKDFNTSNVGALYSMFYGCKSLNNLDLEKFFSGESRYIGDMLHFCI